MVLYTKHLDSDKSSGGGEMAGIGGMLGGGAGGNPADALSDEQKAEVASLVNAMNSNLSNCYLKLEKYELAVEKATLVLTREPDNKKILFRRGKAYYQLKNSEAARNDLGRCDPSDSEVIKVLAAIEVLEKKADKKQKKKLAGMFDKMGHDERSDAAPPQEEHGHGHGGHGGHVEHGHSHGGEACSGHGEPPPEEPEVHGHDGGCCTGHGEPAEPAGHGHGGGHGHGH